MKEYIHPETTCFVLACESGIYATSTPIGVEATMVKVDDFGTPVDGGDASFGDVNLFK